MTHRSIFHDPQNKSNNPTFKATWPLILAINSSKQTKILGTSETRISLKITIIKHVIMLIFNLKKKRSQFHVDLCLWLTQKFSLKLILTFLHSRFIKPRNLSKLMLITLIVLNVRQRILIVVILHDNKIIKQSIVSKNIDYQQCKYINLACLNI